MTRERMLVDNLYVPTHYIKFSHGMMTLASRQEARSQTVFEAEGWKVDGSI